MSTSSKRAEDARDPIDTMEPMPPAISPRPARPTAITILGWVFAVFAAVSLISSGFVLVFMHFLAKVAPEGEFPPSSKDFPPGFGAVSWLFEHFLAVAVLQAAVAAFSIYAAVMFLKLRPWSRTYFEVLNWLAGAWALLFGIFFAIMWVDITAAFPAPAPAQPGPPPALFGAFGVFAAVFASLFNAAFPAVFIWLLRSRFVRPAFDRHDERLSASA